LKETAKYQRKKFKEKQKIFAANDGLDKNGKNGGSTGSPSKDGNSA
jgi:hypothetical protein